MCACQDVRNACGQAYHHQAQGQVEASGHQVQARLRALIVDFEEPGVTWVELLTKVLRTIHDTEGESELRETMIKATALGAALEGGFTIDSEQSTENRAPPRSKKARQ